jgi:hypothetical protein
METVAVFAISVVSLILGAVVAWVLLRSGEAMRVQAAVACSQSESQIQIARLEEGLRVLYGRRVKVRDVEE